MPAFVIWHGAGCILAQQATLSGRGSSLNLLGRYAIVLGVCWLSGGLFLHFHYFWTTLKRLWVFAELGKILALLGFVGSLGYVVWSILSGVA